MPQNALLTPLLNLDSYTRTADAIKQTKPCTVLATGVIDSQKCHLACALSAQFSRPFVFITASELKAKEVFDDLSFFLPSRVGLYPARDIVFYSADVKSADITKQRFRVLKRLLENDLTAVVLSVEALFDVLTPRDIFESLILNYSVGEVVSVDGMCENLVTMGYERTELVEGPGQFALRGGIVDVYTPVCDNSVRIELWGDEIDSIRLIDNQSQRSVENLTDIKIFPARELIYDDARRGKAVERIKKEFASTCGEYEKKGYDEQLEVLYETVKHDIEKLENGNFSGSDKYVGFFYPEKTSLLDYIPENALIFHDEPQRIAQHAETVTSEFTESMKNRMLKGYILPSQMDIALSHHDILMQAKKHRQILLTTLATTVKDFTVTETSTFSVKSSGLIKQRLDLLEEDLRYYTDQNYSSVILAGGQTRAMRLSDELGDKGFRIIRRATLDGVEFTPGTVTVTTGSLNKGFEYPLIKLAVITGKEIFGDQKQRRVIRKKKGAKIESFTDLRIGDYVVHDTHGIGIYRGIEKITADNVSRDYLKISYADGGNLFVHTGQMDMLQKYIGGQVNIKVNKLGGAEWNKAKSRVRGTVAILAKDLIELYAKRQAAPGYRYNPDTVWQNEFEELFQYEETEDQLSAIVDVKADMESNRVMDRLICGDVGYGKTEIAIRAAFKAVCDGKQVAYLVPTTILAQQHYNTFTQRMKDFPVKVEMLSRFRTQKQQRDTVWKLSKGAVDIVIGTHRLLSEDVRFKNIGLVVVDEEQRFGVRHKEKLKALKQNVDILTLTATPIPRTLHMSLTGIRDMSLLEEPPQERIPVQTYVMEYNPESVRDAIHRELSRGGQVYFLHNRVRNISETAARIAKLVPEAAIAYAHGQMDERDLENIMMDFIEGQIDVLVCTTIIETGLDIPNVNTIIISDADYMGLAQLYQLRGRVGRSNRTSYAYLMYKRDKILTETSEKRLQTIREFTEFGSGYKIAMRDLEIRGAGNLLGAEQHGQMDAVGYDMYCKLLSEAVRQQRGEAIEDEFETLIDVTINAYIPEYYIKNEEQKLEIYKKISLIGGSDDFLDIQDEITDRYGDMPVSVVNLLNIASLKAAAHSLGVLSVTQRQDKIVVTFKSDAKADPIKIADLINKSKGRILFTVAPNPYLTYKLAGDESAGFVPEIRKTLESLF